MGMATPVRLRATTATTTMGAIMAVPEKLTRASMTSWSFDIRARTVANVAKASTKDLVQVSDFLTGLIKAGVFGVILGSIACHNGLRVTGGAAGVGRATTNTVVQTVVTVIFADLVFTAIFYSIGWN